MPGPPQARPQAHHPQPGDQGHAGHDSATLLVECAAHRELGTAESVSEVLIWRRTAYLRADTTNLPIADGGTAFPPTSRPVGLSMNPQDLHRGHR